MFVLSRFYGYMVEWGQTSNGGMIYRPLYEVCPLNLLGISYSMQAIPFFWRVVVVIESGIL